MVKARKLDGAIDRETLFWSSMNLSLYNYSVSIDTEQCLGYCEELLISKLRQIASLVSSVSIDTMQCVGA